MKMNEIKTEMEGKEDYTSKRGKGSKSCNKSRTNRSKNSKYSDRPRTGQRKGGNDSKWHTPNDRMLRDVATFSFHTPTGAKRHLTPYSTSRFALKDSWFVLGYDYPYIPGVMQYDIIPAIGNTDDGGSPINTSAKAYFSYVRNNKSGTAPYQPADLMFVTAALANVYSCLNWLVRVYGLSNLYTPVNTYLPEAIFYGEGINYKSVVEHKSEFRAALNNLIYQAAQWFIPNKMYIFQYLTFLFKDVYTEGESVKDQIYFNHPVGFYTYVEGEMDAQNNVKPGYLKFKPLAGLDGDTSGNDFTWDTLIKYAQDMIDALTKAEIVNIITADIRNAFPESDFLKLALVTPEYMVTPVNDRVTMLTFKNAFPMYGGTQLKTDVPLNDATIFDITQKVGVNNSYIVSTPTITLSGTTLTNASFAWALLHSSPRIVSVAENEVDAPIIMDITRLSMCADVDIKYDAGKVTQVAVKPIFGAGILWRCHVISRSQGGAEPMYRNDVPSVVVYDNNTANGRDDILMEAELEAFKYHPAIYNVYWDSSTGGAMINNVCYDYDVTHLLTLEEMRNLNRTSLLALYAVPNVAVVI